jgi:hypothetical protein
VRSEGVGPSRSLRTTRPSTVRVYRSATSTASLWTASNRLPPVYETGALPDELQRLGCRAETRTPIHGSRGRCPAIRRPGIGTGDASRTRMPRGLSSRGLPSCRHSRVRRQGLDPRSLD